MRVRNIDGFGQVWYKDLSSSIEAVRAWFKDLEKIVEKHTGSDKRTKWEKQAICWVPIARTKLLLSNLDIMERHTIRWNGYQALRGFSKPPDECENVISAILERSEPYRYSMNLMADGRRAFVASGYIGLGPQAMQLGDLVCILLGASVPFVLCQRMNGSYTLVGDAYVYGIMDGKFVKDDPLVEDFTIA